MVKVILGDGEKAEVIKTLEKKVKNLQIKVLRLENKLKYADEYMELSKPNRMAIRDLCQQLVNLLEKSNWIEIDRYGEDV